MVRPAGVSTGSYQVEGRRIQRRRGRQRATLPASSTCPRACRAALRDRYTPTRPTITPQSLTDPPSYPFPHPFTPSRGRSRGAKRSHHASSQPPASPCTLQGAPTAPRTSPTCALQAARGRKLSLERRDSTTESRKKPKHNPGPGRPPLSETAMQRRTSPPAPASVPSTRAPAPRSRARVRALECPRHSQSCYVCTCACIRVRVQFHEQCACRYALRSIRAGLHVRVLYACACAYTWV